MAHMIELRKVSKFYTNKDTVSTGFSKIDLKLDMGEFVAITGESGSGKSTLLNVISGLDTYEEGEMFVNGEDTSAYRTQDYERYRKTYIGNIFQDFNLINSYTVYQNIELSMVLIGKNRRERRRRVLELLDLVDMKKYRRTKASRLSGGQKQRVAIARALAKDAPIIVADEPTGNLDSNSAMKVMETLYQISKDKLVVIVTHNYEQAEPFVTRKITMHDGRIIEDKKIARVKTEAEEYSDVYDALVELSEEPAAMAGTSLTEADEADFRQYARKGGRAERNAAQNPAAPSGKKSAGPSESSGKKGRREKKPGSRERAKSSAKPERTAAVGRISAASQLRLGLRNTFNLPTKFILLLIVYLFITAAVLSQYASTKLSLHQNEIMGYNQYFQNQDPARIILKKEDQSAFTDADYEKIDQISNIKSVVKNDLGLDTSVMLESDTIDISGPTYPVSTLNKDVDIGRLPEKKNEIVLVVDEMSYAYDTLIDMGEEIVGEKYYLDAMDSLIIDWGERLVDDKVKVVGVVFDDESDLNNPYGNTYIYISDELADEIMLKIVAASSKVTLDFSGVKEDQEGRQVLFPSDSVPEGEVYLFEETAYQYFDEGMANGKKLGIEVSNRYFSDQTELDITGVVKEDTLIYWLGEEFDKENYDLYSSRIYINTKDFNRLFLRGDYQVSVFMEDEKLEEETLASLRDAGFVPFAMKDSLSDITGGYDFIVNMLSVLMLFVEFVVLFFIAYAVIRLIMRSRNTYYSTLRILGASKRNTDNILRIELVTMMLISYGAVFGLVMLVQKGILQEYVYMISDYSEITERLAFLEPRDYAILFAALLLMSLLIAKRYSRKIFGSSAMSVYREEA